MLTGNAQALVREAVVNGGFETGDLTGWSLRTQEPYEGNDWTVTDQGVLAGAYSGYTSWNYQVYQDLPGIPVADIQSATLLVKTSDNSSVAIEFFYTDKESSHYLNSNHTTAVQAVSFKDKMDPMRVLSRIRISGYEPSTAGTWYDNQNHAGYPG